MALDEKTKTAVKSMLSSIKSPLEVYLFNKKGNEYGPIVEELIRDLTEVSNIKLSVFDLNSEQAKKYNVIYPTTTLFKDAPNVRFVGIPSGHEFKTFLDTFKLVSNRETQLEASVVEAIKDIKQKTDLKVFITPTCPYCPRAVFMALQMAALNENITGSMIEAMEFPELSQKHSVMGVPKTVINDQDSFEGAVPPHIFVKKVQEAL